jgi:topoisomerase-4 subunit A
LEAIKLEQELKGLRDEQAKLEDILGSAAALKRTIVKEIELDAQAHGDERRTLIQAEKRAVAEIRVVDEPVTVVVSAKGWVRARQGHGHDAAAFAFKAGDALYGTFECRTIDTLLVFGSNGRVYSAAVSGLPGARGDGQPITSMIELEAGSQPQHYFAGPADATLLLAGTGGYGLLAKAGDLFAKQRGGKAFLSLAEGEKPLPPARADGASQVACLSLGGRLLTFTLDELKLQPKGGRGLTLLSLEGKDALVSVAPFEKTLRVLGSGRGGRAKDETLGQAALAPYKGARARKGKPAELGFKPTLLLRG